MTDLIELSHKYGEDMGRILDYIDYLETFFLSSIMTDHASNSALEFEKNFTIADISAYYTTIKEEIARCISELQERISDVPAEYDVSINSSLTEPTPIGDALMFINNMIIDGEDDRFVIASALQNEAKTILSAEKYFIDDSDKIQYRKVAENSTYVNELIEYVLNLRHNEERNELSERLIYAQNSSKALELFNLNNQLNIYRQCFIQTMTFFDSCVFDMVKICINHDFFKWLELFSDSKITTHEMARLGSFEEFQSEQTEKMLKSCYVKDILVIMQKLNKQLFEQNGRSFFAIIMEIIQRRNVHIHHNGISDKSYVSKYNIYSVSEGDYLEIDKSYLENTIKITSQIIANVSSFF